MNKVEKVGGGVIRHVRGKKVLNLYHQLNDHSLSPQEILCCFFCFANCAVHYEMGIAAGRKTMVATTVLFVLSGPVKAITYLLLHGLLGFAMGTFWRTHSSEMHLRTS
ncbi:hypothetical protein Sango_0111400 [Sesamum angolense]|uniref:Uncharacterized protein n=1 Tax=Sesamum angolense TaxID=2727404 RepID=A0AAE1XFC6_9LAMI|nr:hypothetical protein Sango_0111400 [Sesamum angolense]